MVACGECGAEVGHAMRHVHAATQATTKYVKNSPMATSCSSG